VSSRPFEAWVFDRRAKNKDGSTGAEIRKTFPTLAAAKGWRAERSRLGRDDDRARSGIRPSKRQVTTTEPMGESRSAHLRAEVAHHERERLDARFGGSARVASSTPAAGRDSPYL